MRSITINSADGVSVDINKYDNTPTPSPEDVWQRPSDWLPLPEVDGTQQIFAVLFAVDNTNYNRASFGLDDNVIINWGDGNIENYSAGTQQIHDYVFSSIPSATQTTEGYRQVVITITPQAGNNLTGIYGNNTVDSGSLDVVASGTLLYPQYLNGMPRLQHAKMLCKLYTGVTACPSLVSLEFGYESPSIASFTFCPNLKYIPNFSTAGLDNYEVQFQGCSSLINLPAIDYSVFTNFASAFADCSAITTTPPIVVTGTPDMNGCFKGCVNLYKANIVGTPASIEKMFLGCVSLLEFPALDLRFASRAGTVDSYDFFCDFQTRGFKAYEMKNTMEFIGETYEDPLNQRFTRATLIEIMTNLGLANAGAKLRISGCIGFNNLTNDDKAIATNKGWVIT
jgi:hypothetical protein